MEWKLVKNSSKHGQRQSLEGVLVKRSPENKLRRRVVSIKVVCNKVAL